MTKAEQILALYAECVGKMPERKIPKFVAAELNTTDAYVRTVARQRKGRGRSEAEQRYWASPLGRQTNRRRCRNYYWRYRDRLLKERSERKQRQIAREVAEARA